MWRKNFITSHVINKRNEKFFLLCDFSKSFGVIIEQTLFSLLKNYSSVFEVFLREFVETLKNNFCGDVLMQK